MSNRPSKLSVCAEGRTPSKDSESVSATELLALTDPSCDLQQTQNGLDSQQTQNGLNTDSALVSEADDAQANWDDTLTEALIRVYADFLRTTSRSASSQKKMTGAKWKQVMDVFLAATGRRFTRVQLKNRIQTLRNLWGIWCSLLRGETCMGWDAENGTVQMSEERWARKLREVPRAARFRKKGPLLSEEQHFIFTGSLATGEQAWTSATRSMPHGLGDEDENDGAGFTNLGVESEGEANLDLEDEWNGDHGSRLYTQEATHPAGYKNKKRKVPAREKLFSSIDEMISFWKTCRASKGVGSTATSSSAAPDEVDVCLQLLEALPSCSHTSNLYRFGVSLFTKPGQRRVFMKLPTVETHKQFIEDAMNGHWSSN